MIVLVVLLCFISLVAFVACWICYALNLENKSLLEAEERTNRDFNSAIDRRDEKIADLIHQVEEAESQAREYKQAAFAASERLNKQADELSEAITAREHWKKTASVQSERHDKVYELLGKATRELEQVRAEYDAYREQVNQAIDRLRGQSLNSQIGSTADYPDADFE